MLRLFNAISGIEEKILGSREKFELNHRLANLLLFTFSLVCLLTSIYNNITKLHGLNSVIPFIYFLFFTFLYYLLRIKCIPGFNYRLFCIITQIGLSFLYCTNFGIRGVIFIFYLIIFLSVLFIVKKNLLFFVVFNLNVILLILIERIYPEFIFVLDDDRITDQILFTVFISFFYIFFRVRIAMGGYNEERAKVIVQKDEIEKRNQHIRELMNREQMINSARLNFFTNISHEFRTPLTLLSVPLELLMEKETDVEKLAAYKTISDNTKQLKELVDQILDLRKLESGSLELSTTLSDIVSFVRFQTQSFIPLSEVRKINLKFSDCVNAPLILAFDTEKVEKIISNILLNAFKFTPAGGTILTEVRNGAEKNKPYAEIRISDTGKGIPQEYIGDIFKPFYQAPDTEYGTGIGLTLANEYVQAHGGHLTVESQENVGTTFTILLPVNDKSAVDGDSDSWLPNTFGEGYLTQNDIIITTNDIDENKGATLKKRSSILIVEDNAEVLSYIEKIMVQEYHVVKAYDGKEAWELAIQVSPDIILSDIMMPEIGGIELCSRIKSDERTSHIPVILLTGKTRENDIIKGLDIGADDYLTKPFRVNELKARIRTLVKNRERLRKKFQKNLLSVQVKDIVTNSMDEKFLNQAIECVEKNMNNPQFGVPELIGQLNISRTLLHLKLKKLTGMPASGFIASIRLRRAAMLMKQTTYNITEISYQVGYNEISYFSSSFKKIFGVSPKEFQNGNYQISHTKQESSLI